MRRSGLLVSAGIIAAFSLASPAMADERARDAGPSATAQKDAQPLDMEESFWRATQNPLNLSALVGYLDIYPDGRHADKARRILDNIKHTGQPFPDQGKVRQSDNADDTKFRAMTPSNALIARETAAATPAVPAHESSSTDPSQQAATGELPKVVSRWDQETSRANTDFAQYVDWRNILGRLIDLEAGEKASVPAQPKAPASAKKAPAAGKGRGPAPVAKKKAAAPKKVAVKKAPPQVRMATREYSPRRDYVTDYAQQVDWRNIFGKR